MPLDPHSTYKITPGVELSEMEDGYVAYQAARDMVHYLNPTAAILYLLVGEGHTAAAMTQLVQSAFALGEPPQQEVAEGLAGLLAQHLIEPC